MKRVALVTSVILLAIVSIACKQNKPEPVVEKYFTHLCRGEFEEIQSYVTEEHRPYYALLKQFAAEGKKDEEKPQVKVTDIKCEIQADTVAMCSCLVQEGDMTPKEQMIQLKKVNKTWLVNQGKEGGGLFSSPEGDEGEETENDFIVEEAIVEED
jgi:hypothetical protein